MSENSIKNSYPYIVTITDPVLSKIELGEYRLRCNELENIKANLRDRIGLFEELRKVCAGMLIITLMVIVIIALFNYTAASEKINLTWFYLVSALFFIAALFFGFKYKKVKKHLYSLNFSEPSYLESIEIDPESCEKLMVWIKDETIRQYVNNIASQNRFPTFAEFNCIEKWVADYEIKKPIVELQKTFNIVSN